jgi:hypothetical protein
VKYYWPNGDTLVSEFYLRNGLHAPRRGTTPESGLLRGTPNPVLDIAAAVPWGELLAWLLLGKVVGRITNGEE